MSKLRISVLSAIVVVGGLVSAQQAPPAPATPQGQAPAAPAGGGRAGGGRAGAPAAAGAQAGAPQGRGGGGGGRGAQTRTRKVLLAWADTRNGQAQHAFTSHALAVIERL